MNTPYLSADSELKTKHSFKYSLQGFVKMDLILQWDQQKHQWQPQERTRYKHDENGRVIEYLAQAIKKSDSSWDNRHKYEYSYYSDGSKRWVKDYTWGGLTSVWFHSQTDSFNNEKNATIQRSYQRSTDPAPLILGIEVRTFYNSEGRIDSLSKYNVRNSRRYELSTKKVYQYNEKGHLSALITYVLDSNKNQFETYRIEYTYTSFGAITSVKHFSFHFGTIPTSKTSYSYNDEKQLETVDRLFWNSQKEEFDKVWQRKFTYDDSNRIASATVLHKHKTENEYVNAIKHLHTYNGIDSTHRTLVQEWLNNSWKNSLNARYYYSGIFDNINAVADKEAPILYPNPVSEQLHFRALSNSPSTIHIYTLQGKLVLVDRLQDEGLVSISKIPSGSYIYQIMFEDHSVSGRFVKQ